MNSTHVQSTYIHWAKVGTSRTVKVIVASTAGYHQPHEQWQGSFAKIVVSPLYLQSCFLTYCFVAFFDEITSHYEA